jgi:hypothetical protein
LSEYLAKVTPAKKLAASEKRRINRLMRDTVSHYRVCDLTLSITCWPLAQKFLASSMYSACVFPIPVMYLSISHAWAVLECHANNANNVIIAKRGKMVVYSNPHI